MQSVCTQPYIEDTYWLLQFLNKNRKNKKNVNIVFQASKSHLENVCFQDLACIAHGST